jgi:hypothetical protein
VHCGVSPSGAAHTGTLMRQFMKIALGEYSR